VQLERERIFTAVWLVKFVSIIMLMHINEIPRDDTLLVFSNI